MRKRPLCVFVLCFLAIQTFAVCRSERGSGKTVFASERFSEGRTECVGVVSRREESEEYHIYYLEEILTAPSQEQLSKEKLLVYVRRDTAPELEPQEAGPQVRSENAVLVGNRIRVWGEIQFPEPATNPGMFDREFYNRTQKIAATVWADDVEILDENKEILGESLTAVRLSLKKKILEILGSHNGHVLCMMLLGEKRDIDPMLKELYQLSGIGHVLSISGLHMSFLGGGLYRFLRARGMPFFPAGLTGGVFLSFYTLMIGGGVSSTRALIMYLVRMGAEITGRTYDAATSLSLAALVLVLQQPLYLMDAGFLLSFGAILGIVLFQPMPEKPGRTKKNPAWLSAVKTGLWGSLSVHLILLPILVFFYFEFPVYSLFLNLIVIPLMSWVLGAGLIGSLFLVCGDFTFPALKIPGVWLLKSCGLALDFNEAAAAFTLKLPGARVLTGRPDIWRIAGYYLLLFAGYLLYRRHVKKAGHDAREPEKCHVIDRRTKKVRRILLGLYAAAVCLLLTGRGTGGQLEITMLDVGQGDGIVIRLPNGRNCLVDGGSSDVSSVGRYRLEPFLKSQGIQTLHYVFVSHGDQDHISGIREMIDRQESGVRIETLLLPVRTVWDETLYELAEAAQKQEIKVVELTAGNALKSGKVMIRCIQPEREDSDMLQGGNESSMVLELNYLEFDLLLTGDVEAEGEQRLAKRLGGKQYDVLKVAHHGSGNSSSASFLEDKGFVFALISVGRDNRYGHPHPETLDRLEHAGIQIYNTREAGAITIRTNGKSMKLETYLRISDETALLHIQNFT